MGEHLNGANEGRVNCAVRKEMSTGLREAQGFLKPLSLRQSSLQPICHLITGSAIDLGDQQPSLDNQSAPVPPRTACEGCIDI